MTLLSMRYLRAPIVSPLHLVILTLILAGCASGPRNPVFGQYPASVAGHTTICSDQVRDLLFARRSSISSGRAWSSPQIVMSYSYGSPVSPSTHGKPRHVVG